MPGVPIIDCLFPLELIQTDRPDRQKELAREMDRAAIDRVLLTPCSRWHCERHWGPDGISLAEVQTFVTAMPQRFGGLASYNPFAIPESMALIELAMESDYSGVYVQTEGADILLSDSRMVPLYRKCQAAEIPVIVQVGLSMSNIATIESLAPIAEDFPELKLIAGVCGPIELPATLELCERFGNVYFAFDGSLIFPDDIRRFRNSELAQRRAMFGSNGHRWVNLIEGIARLDMPYEWVRAFMHDNAASVLHLDVHSGVSI